MSKGVEALVEMVGKLGGAVEDVRKSEIYIRVPREAVRAVAKLLYDSGAYLKTCAGVDERGTSGFYSIYYIFGLDSHGVDAVLKVLVPEHDPLIPSILPEVPAADWCELEIRDLLGIELSGRLTKRLVLPEDWPDGVYPLRKEFRYDEKPPRVVREELPEEVGIPVGPYHPALHEPEYFELYVEGEKVVDVVYRGFHVHRGIEKLAESPRFTYKQIPFLAERICGICGFVHSTCYVMAVEKAAGIGVPERAEFIRSIVLEVERLHSHLLWLGVAAHLLGYDAGFMHTWRIRERVMVLAEYLTGSRKTYGINVVGGVRKDLNVDKIDKTMKTVAQVREEFKKLADAALSVPQIKARAVGTGVLTKSEARALSVVGPVARASGLYRDIRKDYPYLAYRKVSFRVPLYTEGDNLARLLVRVEEVFESIEIIKQLIDMLPGGGIVSEEYEIPPGRRAVAAVEAPRGEDVHFVITGLGRPYRWRVRAPTYQNIPALRAMLRGTSLADAPLTIASIDPCFSCTDRVLVVDVRSSRRSFIKLVRGG
ncbi:MAG: NADH-quinone oxidoreductase subunit C [Sulfolobales archaeon]|nr:NADH-quinone oxidoreductase subunit C [Sulfolobales archaeon]MDW8010903.1 NADH-quinone oxidoreductase subunit C [Sulfolobales archaeon]